MTFLLGSELYFGGVINNRMEKREERKARKSSQVDTGMTLLNDWLEVAVASKKYSHVERTWYTY